MYCDVVDVEYCVEFVFGWYLVVWCVGVVEDVCV